VTNKDDIKGLVSLKFLRPCSIPSPPPHPPHTANIIVDQCKRAPLNRGLSRASTTASYREALLAIKTGGVVGGRWGGFTGTISLKGLGHKMNIFKAF
jgi:hypothetical protein